jgi:hypothetical protein
MKRITWRTSALTIVALAAGLVAAAPAGATPPTREDLGDLGPYEFSVDCSPYGFNFSNIVQGEESLWIETFYDAAGNAIRIVAHDSFTETDTNSVSGKTLRARATRVDTLDLVARTRTVVGESFLMTDPGTGAVVLDVGRVVFDAPFHVSFEAGRHDDLHGYTNQLVCSALAED